MNNSEAEKILGGYAKNLPHFILKTGFFVTKDEHRDDGEFPLPADDYSLEYLHTLCEERLVIVPKSRQIKITWLTAAYLVARALTRRNLLAIYQNKREDDAQSFMERCYFLYNHLPVWIRTIRPKLQPPKENKMKLELTTQHSKVWGIPAGADIIRSNTVSIFVSDESNFQPEAKASLRAAAPSAGKKGQMIFISSANFGGLNVELVKGEW